MAWTTPATWASEDWNLQIRDNMVYMHTYLTPIGSIVMSGQNTNDPPPTGWLFCNGGSYSTTGTYAALFSVIQYRFGGSGSSFNVPDFNSSGRYPKGAAGSGVGAPGSASYSHDHGSNIAVLTGGNNLLINNPDWNNVISGNSGNHNHGENAFVSSGNTGNNLAAGNTRDVALASHNHSFGGYTAHPGHQHGIDHTHGITISLTGGITNSGTSAYNFEPNRLGVAFIIRYA